MSEYRIACHGKYRFRNRAEAKARANKIRTTGGPAFNVYACRYCFQWHFGHRPGQATYLRRGIHGPIPIKELPR